MLSASNTPRQEDFAVYGARVLIIDDEGSARVVLAKLLQEQDYAVETAADGPQALSVLQRCAPDGVIVKLTHRGGQDGVELIRTIRASTQRCVIIAITVHIGEIATKSIRAGANAFLVKPLNLSQLLTTLEQALQVRSSVEVDDQPWSIANTAQARERVIGHSHAMQEVMDLTEQAATVHSSVLFTGEAGTGKQLLAYMAHKTSPRRHRPIINVVCGGVPSEELEVVLFGQEQAHGVQPGALERADGGTVLLNEVSEIALPTQVKLLRYIEEHEFERIGGTNPIRPNVRVFATSSRPLKPLLTSEQFLSELFYRLNIVDIRVPPLRQRISDIGLLADHFMRRYASEHDSPVRAISKRTLEHLESYGWSGNVQELEMVMEHAVLVCEDALIEPEHLPPELCARADRPGRRSRPARTAEV